MSNSRDFVQYVESDRAFISTPGGLVIVVGAFTITHVNELNAFQNVESAKKPRVRDIPIENSEHQWLGVTSLESYHFEDLVTILIYGEWHSGQVESEFPGLTVRDEDGMIHRVVDPNLIRGGVPVRHMPTQLYVSQEVMVLSGEVWHRAQVTLASKEKLEVRTYEKGDTYGSPSGHYETIRDVDLLRVWQLESKDEKF